MFILGLTGSIGMGKSETAKMFRRLGIPVFDADAEVHKLLAPGGRAVPLIEKAFPGVTKDGAVDRPALGARVFGKPAELRRLEAIIHPMVGRGQRAFLAAARRRRLPLVVLDIPLLFEGRGEDRCDATAVVSAPYPIQRQRVLARPNMSEEKFRDILKQQVPDVVKRQRADFVLPTGQGRHHTLRHVRRLITMLRNRIGHTWPPSGRPRRRPSRHPCRRPVHARNRIRH
ncbi:MAG: dephospho-CoA kinase [Alphaproteobacteria bacterium]|jgi:dephospho-CoA kinase|nr:dephospho-CoA kinase [Alphaproteobacteria bacterium]MDP6565043.1 dephospho-CoA kinase [Alphaproteobacteria bacterium]MDP6815067.1 dephospho-CoA kinase [Alphaproteobacteria bacterium]